MDQIRLIYTSVWFGLFHVGGHIYNVRGWVMFKSLLFEVWEGHLGMENMLIPIWEYLQDVFNEAHLRVLFEDKTIHPDNYCVMPTYNVKGGVMH